MRKYKFQGKYLTLNGKQLTEAQIFTAPQISFEMEIAMSPRYAPLTVEFLNTLIPGDGTITAINWDFGDGNTAQGGDPDHTFQSPGTFTIKATVTDSNGLTGSFELPLTVLAVPSSGPTADFSIDPSSLSGEAPFTVSVTSLSTGEGLSHEWTWGDGTPNASGWEDVVHTYLTEGAKPLKLKVTDQSGLTDEKTVTITVLEGTGQNPNERKILMLYGDVAADGTIPSGGASPFHQMRLSDSGNEGFSKFAGYINSMTEEGYTFVISEAYDSTFNLVDLVDYDVLFLASSQRIFNSGEIDLIEAWVNNGGGLVGFTDSALGGNYGQVGAQNGTGQAARNPLFERFGMQFHVDQADGVKTLTLASTEAIADGIQRTFKGEGVSPIRIDTSAGSNEGNPRQVVAYTDNINHTQGVSYAGDICAIAEALPGLGRVVALFDRNLVWNSGAGTNIDEGDNRQVMENIFKRVSGFLEAGPGGGGGGTGNGNAVLLAETNFPTSASLNDKDAWRSFWDTNGLGRYNSSGGQFTSSPITCTNNILKIPFKNGDWGGAPWQNAGAIIYQSLPYHTGNNIYWEYDIKFSPGFDWGNQGEQFRGGKFGLGIVVGNVGVGSNPGSGNFAVTTMWRDGGQADMYLYHAGQAGNWPDRIIYTNLVTGAWLNYKVEVKNNDPGQNNGYIKIWVNDVLVYNKTDFQFGPGGDILFKPSFANFFGGDSSSWRARNDCDIQYSNIKVYNQNPNS